MTKISIIVITMHYSILSLCCITIAYTPIQSKISLHFVTPDGLRNLLRASNDKQRQKSEWKRPMDGSLSATANQSSNQQLAS